MSEHTDNVDRIVEQLIYCDFRTNVGIDKAKEELKEKLQQEKAKLKAVINELRSRQGKSRIIEQSLAKIKADAIRKMIDDLGMDDSGWYGDIEEYADNLEQDHD